MWKNLGRGKNMIKVHSVKKISIKHNFNKEPYLFSWILHIKTLLGTVTFPPLVLPMHSHFICCWLVRLPYASTL